MLEWALGNSNTFSRDASGIMGQITYKDAGVDLELYEQAMQRLPRLMQKTHTPRVIDMPGGFAGLFRLNDAKRRKTYQDPVLVSGTDGVGTKIKVAILAGVYNTVGIDLVAMSVNDCLCIGAECLFFLDYLALGKDDPDLIANLVEGVSAGCQQADSALLGGETAIMPDLYAPGDFDLAGFCVGVVERKKIIDGRTIRPGDAVIGIESSGFHSNGYSLVRKAVFEVGKLGIDDYVSELERSVGEALLTPTMIYARPITGLLNRYKTKSIVGGMAHITGEGLPITSNGCCPPGAASQSIETPGKCRRFSHGYRGWAGSTAKKCSACSTWGSDSCWSCGPVSWRASSGSLRSRI